MGDVGELKKKAKYWEKELENLEDIPTFVAEQVLEVQRVQSWTRDGWETSAYVLLLTSGGPTVTLEVPGGIIRGVWGSEKVEYPLSEEAKKKAEELDGYLAEVFGD